MATFRKVRELLLTSFDDGDISEDEFLLLYDVRQYQHFVYQLAGLLKKREKKGFYISLCIRNRNDAI